MANPLFYAKIILFGEYGMIENSQGLVVPYSFYKGTLKFSEANSDSEFEINSTNICRNIQTFFQNLTFRMISDWISKVSKRI